MISYQLSSEAGHVFRWNDGTRTTIPLIDVPGLPPNSATVEYRKWLAAGGIPLPATPVNPLVPESISPAQGQLILLEMGLSQTVLDNINQLDEPEKTKARIAYYSTTEWRRDSPFLCTLAQANNLSSEQLDELFIKAAEIVI